MSLSSVMGPVLLALGFGFVIFWHELGHFLAAKWVGIKVEQFAVGFGKAIVAWRKGIGLRVGSTTPEYRKRIIDWLQKEREGVVIKDDQEISPQDEHRAAAALGISETEYRWNWIPLGGYVKMLGQDDMNPNAQSADPRAFNRKSIGARMLVVSAGVIMNVILAMIGFAVVFHQGFDAPPTVVGHVLQGSPAQKAGIRAGDRIAHVNGEYQHDFTKLQPNIALAGEGNALTINIERPDGTYIDPVITPVRPPYDRKGFLSLGVAPAYDLIAVEDNEQNRALVKKVLDNPHLYGEDPIVLMPGDKIVAVNGKRLEPTNPDDRLSKDPAVREAYFDAKVRNLATFDRELQSSGGKPLTITVVGVDGKETERTFKPKLAVGFDGRSVRIAGMAPRSVIEQVSPDSPVVKQVLPGDVIEQVSVATATAPAALTPTIEVLKDTLNDAGNNGYKVSLKIDRKGEILSVNDISTIRLETKKRGLGVNLDMETDQAVVAAVETGSAADRAGIVRGSRIVKINDTPVTSWFDVINVLRELEPNETATVAVAGSDKTFELKLTAAELDDVRGIQFTSGLELQSFSFPRQTDNVFKAMGWGVVETTSLLKQFYISLQRMVDGSVSVKNMMGPVGIFSSGTTFAERGHVWLIWFLCMISANLAVVNFLPIPIVDGGLFTFLIIEKIQGRPISAKTQTAAQIVGLALLGFVFLFATWQDISRIIWGWG